MEISTINSVGARGDRGSTVSMLTGYGVCYQVKVTRRHFVEHVKPTPNYIHVYNNSY